MTAATDTTKADLIIGGTKGKPVRFSYLSVFQPKLNTESGNEEFSVLVLIPKSNIEDVASVQGAIRKLSAAEWTSKGKKLPPKFWNPLRDGDTDTKQDGSDFGPECKGHYLLNVKCTADYPPNVVGTVVVDGRFQALSKREFKSGDWGRVKLTMRAYIKGSSGVGAYLSSIQKTREGEPLGSQSSAENDFKDFMDEDDESSMLS
jgi:hypothetical protein